MARDEAQSFLPGSPFELMSLNVLVIAAVILMAMTGAAVGLEPTPARFFLILALGLAFRVGIGATLLPDHEAILTLHKQRLSVTKGEETVFSCPLGDLAVERSERTITLTGPKTLVLHTNETPESLARLIGEIRDRAEAFGSHADVPKNLVRGTNREST